MNDVDILQTCIDDVLAGRRTPDACAALYPQFPELRAYLNAAIALRATKSLSLSQDVEHRIEIRLRQRAGELAIARPATARPARRPVNLRWVVAPAIVVALLVAGIGTTAAAGTSNPGDVLYGLKRADETAQVLLSLPSARASIYAGQARHRLDEMTVVVQRRDQDAAILNNLSDDLTEETSAALAFVDDAPVDRQADILNNLVQMTDEQQAVLASVQQVAPPEAQAGLKRALQASGAGHAHAVERLEQVLASQKPKNSPPGAAASSATATPPATQPDDETHVPPGQTHVPPGQTQVPPGQTKVPPGQTHVPPGQGQEPPGQTNVPPGQTNVPPGQTKVPPGQDMTPQPTRHAPGNGF